MTTRLLSGAALALAALTAASAATAQTRVGSAAAPFLTVGAGARSTALGSAYTAEALDGNPAGAARRLDGLGGNVVYSHAEWFAGIAFDGGAVVLPLGPGTVGLSVLRVGYADQEVTTVDRPDGTGESYGASDLAFGLSYAQMLTDQFAIGGTVKGVQQRIWDMSASAIAFDIGFHLQTNYAGGLRLAASIQNFGTQMSLSGVNTEQSIDPFPNTQGNGSVVSQLETESYNLPLSFRFGVSTPVASFAGAELRAFADANQVVDNSLNADLGGELTYAIGGSTLGLRAGYRDAGITSDGASHFTYGVGIDVPAGSTRLGFNFAYLPFQYLDNTQVFDLSVQF